MFWLAIRRLRQHWPRYLALLLIGWLAAAAISLLPLYSARMSEERLRQTLSEASVPRRNVLYRGLIDLEDAMDLEADLDPLLRERVIFRRLALPAWLSVRHPGGEVEVLNYTGLFIHLWSMEPYEPHVTLVEGEWPQPVTRAGTAGELVPKVEAALAQGITELANVGVGDILVPSHGLFDVQITGIITATDGRSEVWWDDTLGFLFTGWRNFGQGGDIDELNAALMLPRESMEEFVTPFAAWRILLDLPTLHAAEPEALQQQFTSLHARYSGGNQELISGLAGLLSEHLQRRDRAQRISLLLIAQSGLTGLLLLTLVASQQIRRQGGEIASLSARGISARRIILLLALESGVVLFLASLPLALLSLVLFRQLWQVSIMPSLTWQAALAAILACWLALLFTVIISVRHSWAEWRDRLARYEPERAAVGLLVAGIALLLLGSVAYRQVSAAAGSDALMLLSPTLIIAGASLLWSMLFAALLRRLLKAIGRGRELGLFIALARLSRTPATAVPMVLLLTLSIGFGLFSSILATAIAAGEVSTTMLGEQALLVLRLNSLILFILAITGFLVSQLAASHRLDEHALLHGLGLSRGAYGWLLVWRALITLIIGLVGGIGSGLLLVNLTQPLFGQLMGQPLTGPLPYREAILTLAAGSGMLLLLLAVVLQWRSRRARLLPAIRQLQDVS